MPKIIKKSVFYVIFLRLLSGHIFANEQFPQVITFGDSLSDVGNVDRSPPFPLQIGILGPETAPKAPLAGLVWSQAFSRKFGINLLQSNVTNNTALLNNPVGTDFAWAGATMVGRQNNQISPTSSTYPNVSEQITTYLGTTNNRVNPSALYSLWAGGNDIGDFLERTIAGALGLGAPVLPNPAVPLVDLGAALAGQVTRLHDLGAKHLLAFNLPNIGATPRVQALGAASAALATAVTAAQNQNITNALGALSYRVIYFDVKSLSNYILSNPAQFGITNVGIPVGSPTDFYFTDGFHPNTRISQILGDAVFSVVQGPLYVGLIGEAALSQMGAYEQVIHSSLGSNQEGGCKKARWTPIISGVYEHTTREKNGTAMPGNNTQNRQLILGGHYCLTPNLTLGGLVGYSAMRNTFTNNGGHFDMSQTRGVVFANLTHGDFYVRIDLQGSFVDVPDIRRNINLGGFGFPTKAHTRGYTLGSLIEAGWWAYKTPTLHTGPVAQASFESGKIKGFNEGDSAAGVNLVFWDQKVRSLTGGLGWETRYKFDQYNTWGRVMAMVENRPSRFVDARVSTLSNTRFGMEFQKLKARPWAYVELGLGRMTTERIQVTAGLSANLFRQMQEGTTAHSLSAMLKVAF